MDGKAGVAAALDAIRPHEEGPEVEPVQEDLLGLPAVRRPDLMPGVPRRGRPPGSRNRRTAEWAEYLLARYTSPLEVLAQVATTQVGELAARLGCSPLEALQEVRHCAVALLPFLHQRMPIAVDVTNRKIVNLTIVDQPPEEEEADSLASAIIGIVEHQRLSDVADGADGANMVQPSDTERDCT